MHCNKYLISIKKMLKTIKYLYRLIFTLTNSHKKINDTQVNENKVLETATTKYFLDFSKIKTNRITLLTSPNFAWHL